MSKTVLYIAKDDLVVVYPGKGGKWASKKWAWNDKNITNILKEIKTISHHLIILLAPDISYFKKINSDQLLTRALITEQLPKLFPEILASRQWDWKKMEANVYLLEAVTTRVWKWIELAEKMGFILDKITTAKYVAEKSKLELTDAHGLFKAVLAEARDKGVDENVLDITFKEKKDLKKPTLLVLVFLMMITFSFLILSSYQKKVQLREAEKLQKEAAALITPSPTPEITEAPKPEDYNLRLRNNSGIASEASKAAALFNEAGFSNVEIIAATNAAEKKTVKETTVRIKADLPTNIKDIINTLLLDKVPMYQIDMDENDVVDIIIIIGS